MEESVYQDLIPDLPDDFSLTCLAKISHGYHGILESVSKRWRDTLRSGEYSRWKAREGWCGNWLFVLTDEQHNIQWTAYDPEAERWHPLPMMPRSDSESSHSGFSCVSVCKRFLVLGGYYVPSLKNGPSDPYERTIATDDVMLFDPFKKQWCKVASMRTARYNFACASLGGKVYVAGGSNSLSTQGLAAAEVYDILEDKWEDLPPMPAPLVGCFSMSYDRRFHVVGRNGNQVRYFIFNPTDLSWHPVDDLWQLYRLRRNTTTVLGDHIYTILDEGLKSLRISDTGPSDWSSLDAAPLVVLPDHSRKLQPFEYGFAGLQGKLYVVGGKVVKYDSGTRVYSIVKLDLTRTCDPKKVPPLEWREASPMFGTCGIVLGCGSLEE